MIVTIAMVNRSAVPSAADVAAFCAASNIQFTRDFLPSWGKQLDVDQATVIMVDNESEAPLGARFHYLLDRSDIPQDVAYHEVGPDGQPVSKTFCQDAKDDGEDWRIAASHENIEATGDPMCNQTFPDGVTAFELCDAVEESSYAIAGVSLTSFVLPDWGGGAPGGPAYDFMGHLTCAYQIEAGGYKTVKQPDGSWQQIMGARRGPAVAAEMVNRFLGWRLPDDFRPDNGIRFKPLYSGLQRHHMWPTGTNLLDADQARAMLDYVLKGPTRHERRMARGVSRLLMRQRKARMA